jgi:PAS domain S-box-containing protein
MASGDSMEVKPLQAASIISYLPNGTLLTVDEHFTSIFGWTPSEAKGSLLHELILPPPYREAFQGLLSQYERTGNPEFCGRMWQLEGIHKNRSTFSISLSQCETGEGDSKCFIANIEKTNVSTCTISFDMFGSILMNRGSSSTLVEFFGEKDLRGKKIYDFVPDLQPNADNNNARPNYQYLLEGLANGKTTMSVKVVGNQENKDMTLLLTTMNVGMNNTIIFTGTFKQLNPKMEVILLIDAADRIINCNSQVSNTLGYTEQQLNGRPINILLPETALYPASTKSSDSGEGPLKKRKSFDLPFPSIWREESGSKVLEIKHSDETTMMVICTILPVNGSKLCIMLRKVEGTDQTSQELRTVGKYSIGEFIAAGNYGKVKKAHRIDTGEEVAVKIINKKLMNEEEGGRALREIDILRRLDHPNIIRFHEMVDTCDRLYLFMEYMEGGHTLKKYIEKGLSEQESKELFRQIATAILYCHTMQVVHRDIKPTNILIDSTGRAKMIDFGLSAISEAGKLQGTFCGSPAYAPPEIILGTKYMGPAADVWSLGVLLYAMVANKLPFDCLGKILACNWTRPESVSEECRDLLNKMIVYDPSKRISMSDIMLHPWMNS